MSSEYRDLPLVLAEAFYVVTTPTLAAQPPPEIETFTVHFSHGIAVEELTEED